MIHTKKRFIIIDSNALIHRAYHALPPLKTKKGETVNVVYGFLLIFLKTIKDFNPDFIAAAFDLPSPTFRHKEYQEYKIKRPKMPEEFYNQIPKIKEFLKNFNVPIFEKESFEADDIIGTITHLASREDKSIETIILTSDLDMLQLIDENTFVCAMKKGLKDIIIYDKESVEKKFQLSPSQLIDFKALKGDHSDNISGVTGIGEKTSIQLIKDFGSLENLYKTIEERNEESQKIKPKIKETLLKHKEQAFFSKMLVKIRKDANIDFNLDKCRWKGYNYNKKNIIEMLKNFEFYSLINKLP